MKRLLSLLLITVMIFALCACGGEEEAPKLEGFHAGYGRASIAGPTGTPLAGYGDTLNRLSEGMMNQLYATCIAMTDDAGKTVLLYTADAICTNTEWMEDMRKAITEATGVPADCIHLTATHSHSTPDIRDALNQQSTYYTDIYLPGFVQAGKQAMEDRAPATVSSGSTQVQGLNFIRHYEMSDGNMAGDNFGVTKGVKAVKNHHVADEQVQLIRFVRQDKKDIVAINFQAHPKLVSTAATAYGQANRKMQSSDFVGGTRDYVEANADVLFAYYQGAAGNINPLDYYIPTQNTPAQSDIKAYGKALGGAVIEAMDSLTEMTAEPVLKTKQTIFMADSKNGGEKLAMELDAVVLGDIGMVTAPYEMFDTNGLQIKEGSPFETTFVITYANGRFAYVGSDETWDYKTADGSVAYEIGALGYVVRGTGEKLAEEFVSMLEELNG